jgi:hypothetical protein
MNEQAKRIGIKATGVGLGLAIVGTAAACEGKVVNNYISLPTPTIPPATASTETVPGGTSQQAFNEKVVFDNGFNAGRVQGQKDQAIIDAPLINKPAVTEPAKTVYVPVTPDKPNRPCAGEQENKGTFISFGKNEEKTVHAGTVLSGDVIVEGYDYCNYWYGGYYHTEKRLFDNTQRTGSITIALDDERIKAPYEASGNTGFNNEAEMNADARSQAEGTFAAWPGMKTITVFKIRNHQVVSTETLNRGDFCK